MAGVKRTRIDEVDRPTLCLCQCFVNICANIFVNIPGKVLLCIYEDLIDYEEQEEGKGVVKGTRIAEDNEKGSSSIGGPASERRGRKIKEVGNK